MRQLYSLFLGLSALLLGCQPAGPNQSSPPADSTTDPSSYLVLAQKALTYQADFQFDDLSTLLADDVELHLPGPTGPVRLVGRERVLQYWQQWKNDQQVKAVSLSGFNLIPWQATRPMPLANLPGVYVAAVYQRRLTYHSGRETAQPVSLWLHFNEGQLIDRLYSFQPDEPPPD